MTDKDTPTPRTDAVDSLAPNGEPATDHDYRRMRNLSERLERETVELRQQLAELERGEYICNKCGLRKDSEHEKGDF